MTRWFFALTLCAIGLSWLHAEDSKRRSDDSAKTAPASSPNRFETLPASGAIPVDDQKLSDADPVAAPPGTPTTIRVRVPVERTDIVDLVVEGAGKRTAVTKTMVVEQDIPLPTSPEEIQKFRDELKTLRSRQIDALQVENLMKQVFEEREAVRELEAWAKLEQIRKELTDLENAFSGTKAGTVAHTLQVAMPASIHEVPENRPIAPMPDNPFGTTPPSPRDSVLNAPLKPKIVMPIKGI